MNIKVLKQISDNCGKLIAKNIINGTPDNAIFECNQFINSTLLLEADKKIDLRQIYSGKTKFLELLLNLQRTINTAIQTYKNRWHKYLGNKKYKNIPMNYMNLADSISDFIFKNLLQNHNQLYRSSGINENNSILNKNFSFKSFIVLESKTLIQNFLEVCKNQNINLSENFISLVKLLTEEDLTFAGRKEIYGSQEQQKQNINLLQKDLISALSQMSASDTFKNAIRSQINTLLTNYIKKELPNIEGKKILGKGRQEGEEETDYNKRQEKENELISGRNAMAINSIFKYLNIPITYEKLIKIKTLQNIKKLFEVKDLIKKRMNYKDQNAVKFIQDTIKNLILEADDKAEKLKELADEEENKDFNTTAINSLAWGGIVSISIGGVLSLAFGPVGMLVPIAGALSGVIAKLISMEHDRTAQKDLDNFKKISDFLYKQLVDKDFAAKSSDKFEMQAVADFRTLYDNIKKSAINSISKLNPKQLNDNTINSATAIISKRINLELEKIASNFSVGSQDNIKYQISHILFDDSIERSIREFVTQTIKTYRIKQIYANLLSQARTKLESENDINKKTQKKNTLSTQIINLIQKEIRDELMTNSLNDQQLNQVLLNVFSPTGDYEAHIKNAVNNIG